MNESNYDSWVTVLNSSFREVWNGVAGFVPKLIIAILIFIVGAIVGGVVGKVVAHIVRILRIDALVRKANVEEYFVRAGLRLDVGKFLGVLAQWFVLVIFLLAALEVIGLEAVTQFLQQVVLAYLPKVFVAVLILVAAVIIAEAMQRIVLHATKAANLRYSHMLSSVTRWAIWIFALLAALYQLGIAGPFAQTLFTGVVVAVSLAVGLAFGLGGQDAASEAIAKIRKQVSGHHES